MTNLLTPNQQRRLLWLATFGMFAAAAVLSTWLILLPITESRTDGNSNRPRQGNEGIAASASMPPLEAFEPLWKHDYRRPLYDPVAKEKPKPPFQAQLAGTVIEPGYTRAMFTLGNQVEFRAVGETIANGTVLAIDAVSVRVMYEGEELVLTIQQGGSR